MTDIVDEPAELHAALPADDHAPVPAWLFVVTVFFSAALVFVVEPMIARLVLPLLGGSAAVWNTSLAFFQIALLAGYVYAHLLQRIGSVRVQIIAHLAVLAAAAAVSLPLRVTGLFGDPSPDAPAIWLVAVLAVSIGAPFAALSATAPLVQAWHARVMWRPGAREPYVLYAASNVGSLIALIAYPVLVEPNVTSRMQTAGWSLGFGGFVLVAAALGAALWRTPRARTGHAPSTVSERATWPQRLTWLALAAAPSSLMLGVTTYVTTDLGSAPFLWVAPLALYLLTFIIAFQQRPAIPPAAALTLQAAAVALCGVFFHYWTAAFVQALAIHLSTFFLTALVCHQALVARRPQASRLTEFYIWMSVGGVVGGAFNAFVAPLIFRTVVEYPAVLVLACLARPWNLARLGRSELTVILAALGCAVIAIQANQAGSPFHPLATAIPREVLARAVIPGLLTLIAVGALLVQQRGLVFAGLIGLLVVTSIKVSEQANTLHVWRSFFGVMRTTQVAVPPLGDLHLLTHGTTVHGAQASVPAYRCRPLTYYAPEAPIGQVFEVVRARRSAISVGAVGLGAGSVAAYSRPGDDLRFFEIDPLVLRISSDPRNFSYLTECAKGRVDYTLGDARLTLARHPAGAYDILLIDAFTSDSVPAHLLTVEALRMYLGKVKPDGLVIFHLSNRNLDLMGPAQAVAIAAGGHALAQTYSPAPGLPPYWAANEQAVIVAKSEAALAPFLADPRWTRADAGGVRPWTDDYTNLFGALVRRTEQRWGLRVVAAR